MGSNQWGGGHAYLDSTPQPCWCLPGNYPHLEGAGQGLGESAVFEPLSLLVPINTVTLLGLRLD